MPASHVARRFTFRAWLQAFMPHNPTAVAAVAGKVGIDQLLFSPASTAVFFAWANVAAGTPGRTRGDLREKWAPSVKAAWALWVPAMTINMALVPPPMRILWINAMAIVWTNILSGMATSAPAATPVAAEQPDALLPLPLDVSELADALLADSLAAPQAEALAQRARVSRDLMVGGATRGPRDSKEQAPRRGSRDTLPSGHGRAAAPQQARVASPPQEEGDGALSWLFNFMRGPEVRRPALPVSVRCVAISLVHVRAKVAPQCVG